MKKEKEEKLGEKRKDKVRERQKDRKRRNKKIEKVAGIRDGLKGSDYGISSRKQLVPVESPVRSHRRESAITQMKRLLLKPVAHSEKEEWMGLSSLYRSLHDLDISYLTN